MAFIPWPNGVQLCFHFVTAGQSWQFCLGLQKDTGTVNDTDLSDLATAAHTWWTSTFRSHINNGTTLDNIQATNMTAEGAPSHIESVGTTGALNSLGVPLSSALVLSQRTAKRGRSYRGRAYISGLDGTQITSPTDVTAGTVTNLLADFTSLISIFNTAGFKQVVVSRRHNGVVTTPAEMNQVDALVMDAHLDSQRRRLFGRGK